MSIRWIRVTPELLNRLLLETPAAVSDLPRDVQCRSVVYEPFSNCFKLLVESAEFEPIPEGSVAPEIKPIWRMKTEPEEVGRSSGEADRP